MPDSNYPVTNPYNPQTSASEWGAWEEGFKAGQEDERDFRDQIELEQSEYD